MNKGKISKITRRDAVGKVVACGIGGAAVLGSNCVAHGQQQEEAEPKQEEAKQESAEKSGSPDDKHSSDLDRESIMAAGLNEKEAECWKLIAHAAGKFFELEKLHPSDNQEVAAAVHIIQNKLLGRPTYRKYIKEAKSRMEAKE